MRLCSIVCAASVAALLGGCGGGGGHHHPTGPTEAQLQARESGAATDMQGFLDSYLFGDTGLPDERYFIPGFNLDGYDRSGYLARFWDADAAQDQGDDVIRILYGDDVEGEFYDLQVSNSVSPYSLTLPVVVELRIDGGTTAGDATVSTYSSFWSFFMLENPDETFSVTAQAPTWEYEVLTESPETFNFIVNKLKVNGQIVYQTVGEENDPSFEVMKLQTRRGATFTLDLALLAVGQQSDAFLQTAVTARLFYEDSPADVDSGGFANIEFMQDFQPFWDEAPAPKGTLILPPDLAPGQYTLYVRVDNGSADPAAAGVFAYDLVTIPIEVQ